MRALASSGLILRKELNRCTASSVSTSTTMTPLNPLRGFSASSGISRTTTLPVWRCSAMRRSISLPTTGWTILLRSASASLSANTIAASAARSNAPSLSKMSAPKRDANSTNSGAPARCSSRVIASPSMMMAPCSANKADTVDLPEPIPPVSPISIIPRNYAG